MNGMNGSVGYFYESAGERKPNGYEPPATTFGGLMPTDDYKSFDEHFQELYEHYKENNGIDIKRDFSAMIGDPIFMESYKEDLMKPVIEAYEAMSPNDPHVKSVVENVERFWNTKVKSYTESASITSFLPIATLEFPVLVKQFFSSILKDIIEVESVKTPNISKHVRTTYLVDNNTGEEYEYPKCMFDGTWEKIWEASKGHKIREEVVPFTDGRLWKYDIIGGLTDGTPGLDQLSIQFKIIAVQVGGEIIPIPGNGITVEFSTNGTLVNGDLNFEYEGTAVEDTLAGQVNFKDGTISMSSTSGQVTGVVFQGYLSNEKNLRHVSVREKRSIMRFTIEDGPRWNMPFSIEEIEDAAALLDINYYNRMVDEITRTQEMQECMTVIKFLIDEHDKYNGITTDLYNLESLSRTYEADLLTPNYYAGDPFSYIAKVIQFRLKSIIHQMTELTKLDDLSFVITGNPMATQLITEFVQWKQQSGTTIGGISVNGSYGFATDMGANVRVVGSNLYDAYTTDPVEATGERELVLHIYGYPASEDHISFRHLKYTSHLFTSQNQTAYQSTNAPGGAFQIVTATSRFKTFAIQGISADLILLHSDQVYGKAPSIPPITGAPWALPTPATDDTTNP